MSNFIKFHEIFFIFLWFKVFHKFISLGLKVCGNLKQITKNIKYWTPRKSSELHSLYDDLFHIHKICIFPPKNQHMMTFKFIKWEINPEKNLFHIFLRSKNKIRKTKNCKKFQICCGSLNRNNRNVGHYALKCHFFSNRR